MRVLIVDDTTFMRVTIRRILEMHQIDVVGEAENGLEAVKKYKLIQPDLVIMDISMPVMNGIEAVKEIKKFDPDASIIMCSLQGQRANVLEAIKAGAKNFIIKPVKEEKLMREIAKLPLLMFERKKRMPLQPVASEGGISNQMTSSSGALETDNLKNEVDQLSHQSNDYLKGIEDGYLEAKREIASNMLRLGIGMEQVIGSVELDEEDLLKLKKEYQID